MCYLLKSEKNRKNSVKGFSSVARYTGDSEISLEKKTVIGDDEREEVIGRC
jgi:hypothetical protein